MLSLLFLGNLLPKPKFVGIIRFKEYIFFLLTFVTNLISIHLQALCLYFVLFGQINGKVKLGGAQPPETFKSAFEAASA
ncbi:BnaCnng23490D [Brassica napus]|uniref:(rape) hypothetical protein n=1 Tax=Brassica napus TaxID=3708 RepID=A0A078IP33_BRANA|nr:unnamed protein product [Brassica napus]CDY52810.1 BnaCnng23490D [Brassica napus]